MERFDAGKLEKKLKKALDAYVSEVIVSMQNDLGNTAIVPYNEGRFRSSWFAAEGSPSAAVPPEGANSPQTDAKSLKVDHRKTYYLSSNLEYTQSVTVGERVVSQPRTWFTDWRNVRVPKIVETAGKVVKREFKL